jgi:hypothetical protein
VHRSSVPRGRHIGRENARFTSGISPSASAGTFPRISRSLQLLTTVAHRRHHLQSLTLRAIAEEAAVAAEKSLPGRERQKVREASVTNPSTLPISLPSWRTLPLAFILFIQNIGNKRHNYNDHVNGRGRPSGFADGAAKASGNDSLLQLWSTH